MIICHNHVHRHIAKFTSHVTSISRFKSRVGETLTRTVCRDEVFQNRKSFTEGGENRTFNNFTRGLSHQTASSAKLLNLCFITTRTRIHHRIYGINNHALRVTRIALANTRNFRGFGESIIH